MRRKAASALGLLGFAIAAGMAALRGGDLEAAVWRAIMGGAFMAAVGYTAGFIAEKAVREAVDRRAPLKSVSDTQSGAEGSEARQEDSK